MHFTPEINIAAQACHFATREINQIEAYHTDTKNNNPHDLVTTTDLKSERIILQHLQSLDPHTPVFSEETSHPDNLPGRLWVVDSIGGTRNYSTRIPVFAVATSLCIDGYPKFAAIMYPSIDRLYLGDTHESLAIDNFTTKINHFSFPEILTNDKLHRNLIINPPSSRLTIFTDNGYHPDQTSRNLNYLAKITPTPWVNMFGSAVLGGCFAAESNAIYFHTALKPYDNASWPIAIGSGCAVRDLSGNIPTVMSSQAIIGHPQAVDKFLTQIK